MTEVTVIKDKRRQHLKERENWIDQVFALMVQGYSAKEISEEIGLPHRYVWGLARRAIDQHQRKMNDHVAKHTIVDLARLEGMIKALYPKCQSGDKYAIETCLKLLDRKAKLLGLDRPTKVEHSVTLSLSQLVQGSTAIEVDAQVVPSQAVIPSPPDAPSLSMLSDGGEGGEQI